MHNGDNGDNRLTCQLSITCTDKDEAACLPATARKLQAEESATP
jgi:hypothetical protein